MPPDELGGAIAERGSACQDRTAIKVTANIFGELLDRGVALALLLANRLQHNLVEIAAQTPAEFLRLPLARAADQFRRQPHHRARWAGHILDAVHGGAGFLGI